MHCPTENAKGEDKRLNNWQKWIQVRKEFHQQMYKIQSRTPSNLVLNAAEDFRTIKETQMLHEYAKIPEVFSNRGKPSFWDLPPASKKHPSLISVMPKPLDFEVPERLVVGVPTMIQREKDVLTGINPKHSTWFDNEYLIKQNKNLETHLNRIAPHTPDTENLIITGNEATFTTTYDIEESESPIPSFENQSSSFENNLDDVPIKSLQVEDATFTADGCQEIRKYLVFLNYEIGKHDTVCRTISFNNIGGVALRYYWHRQIQKKVLQDLIPRRLPMYAFIFRKNENIILPNSSKELRIYFKTNVPGMYKESWELRTDPNVFDGKIIKGEFILVLHACAEHANFFESESAIEKRIAEGMKYTTVEDTILNIVQRTQIKIADEIEMGHKITEKDLFEAVNAKFGSPGTLPLIYHYNEEVVKKLKVMYDALKTEADPVTWSYRIDDVDHLIIKCNSKQQQQFYRHSFNELVSMIFKTNMIENEEREKFQNIYDLLCIMIDQMSQKIYALRERFKIPFIETYPAVTEEILLKQESLDDNCRSKLYFPDITVNAAKKRIKECKTDEFEKSAMEVLKLLPFDNIEERYKVYQFEKYGINVDKVDAVDKKGKKGKDAGKAKPEKGAKKGKEVKEVKEKSTAPKPILMRKESIIKQESFTKLLTDKIEVIPEYLETYYYDDLPTENSYRMYDYNLYMTIYLLLCETINEIECILEHMKATKRISRQVLRKCIEYGIPTMSDERKITQREFKVMLDSVENISPASSDLSISEPSKTGHLSDISKSYSDYDYEFFQPFSSTMNIVQEVELVNAQTETDAEELFPPKTRIGNVQTDGDDEKFDLVAQIEKELSATSVQHILKPTANKGTQRLRGSEPLLTGISIVDVKSLTRKKILSDFAVTQCADTNLGLISP